MIFKNNPVVHQFYEEVLLGGFEFQSRYRAPNSSKCPPSVGFGWPTYDKRYSTALGY